MKLRGTLGGFGLLLESSDTPESLLADLNSKAEFLRNSISIEFTDTVDGALFAAALHQIQNSGGSVKSVRGHSTRIDRAFEVGQPILPKPHTHPARARLARHKLRAFPRANRF